MDGLSVSMFLQSAPTIGCFTLGPKCPGAEKLILGSIKCSCKQALMDEMEKKITFSFFVLPRLRNTAICIAGFRRSFTLQMTGVERCLTLGRVG